MDHWKQGFLRWEPPSRAKSKYVLFLLSLYSSQWCSAASHWPETWGACGWYHGIFVWLPAAILFGAVIPRIADNMINCAGICIFVPKVRTEALLRDCSAFSEGNKICKARVREDVMEIKLKQEWSCKAAKRNFWICLKNNPLPSPQISHQHALPCRSTCLFKVMPAQALSWVGAHT